jgi:hypothetical protein
MSSSPPWGTITGQQRSSAAETAVNEAISTLVYIGVTIAVSAAILKRDAVTRLWMRLRHRALPAAEARARRLAAELRRDLSRIEHGDQAAARPPRGLYETETR